tara:strand:+ start:71 stop:1483 length:1413 start_codon:yes stop_codon:yes gene_type:complete
MLKFKTFVRYLEERMGASFEPMTRAEWWKYDDKRIQKLLDTIKDKQPVSGKDTKDIKIPYNDFNKKSIEDFIKAGKDARDIKTFKLQTDKGEILSNQIGKGPLFGGKGKGGGATGDTRVAESMQCLYCHAMTREGNVREIEYYTPGLLGKYYKDIFVDASLDEILNFDSSWHNSAYKSAKILIDRGFINKKHTFHKGNKSQMKVIYDMKLKAVRNDKLPKLNDDKWNPGDIWAIKQGVNVKDKLNPAGLSILNDSLVKAFKTRDIVGISLKKVGKGTAKAVVKNEPTELVDYKFLQVKLKADRATQTFWSSKKGNIITDKAKVDLRSSTNFGAMNAELLIGSSARGGRTGWENLTFATKKYLNKNLPDNKTIKSTAGIIEKEVKAGKSTREQDKFFQMVKTGDKRVTRQEFDEGIQKADQGSIHANLAVAHVASALMSASPTKRNEWCKYVLNYAGATGEVSSVYVKVYE